MTTPMPTTSFAEPATAQRLERAAFALAAHGFVVEILDDAAAARTRIKDLIPEGAGVFTGASETLRLSGIEADLTASGRYDAMRPRALAMDRITQMDEIRRMLAGPDVIVGSVAAVTETGSVVAASGSGSQLPGYAGGAARRIWVVGSQKVVPDLTAALSRVENHCLPLESARTQEVHGWPSAVNHLLVLNAEPYSGRSTARVDVHTLQVETVPLLADPRCPSCSTEQGIAAPAALQQRPKESPDSYRSRRVEDYAIPERALANRVCGAIGSATTMNVVTPTTAPVSGRIRMRGSRGLAEIGWSGQANSYRTSRGLAFLEGLERYCGTHPRTSRPILAALDDLGTLALDPRECGVYSDETYAADDALAPFEPAREIPWVPGWSLRDDRPVLVPQKLVYYSTGDDADNFVFECSNGCASGANREEATLFGLLELIERDAFLLAWYAGGELPAVDEESVDDRGIRTMVDRAAAYGYDLRLFDNRMDLPVPVCTALAVRRDGGDGLLGFASAASLDPRTAAAGAISEVLTYLPMLPKQVQARRDELVAMTQDFGRVTALADHAALFGLPEMRRHARRYLRHAPAQALEEAFADWQAPPATDLRADVGYCVDLLAAAGHDTIVVEQTSPEQRTVGLSSVCVIAPGLLPIDFGWARQRAVTMPRVQRMLARTGRSLHAVPHSFP